MGLMCLQVCGDLPWPFRASIGSCQQCGYDCVTGIFSCGSCTCRCSGHRGPSDGPIIGEMNRGEGRDEYHRGHKRPYGGGPDRDEAGSRKGYDDEFARTSNPDGIMHQEHRLLAQAAAQPGPGQPETVTPAGWRHHGMERYPHHGGEDSGDIDEDVCASSANAKCTCGPAPLVVGANCKYVTYNTCTNAFACNAS